MRVLEAPTTRLPVSIHLLVFNEKMHQPKFIRTYSPHPTKEGYLIKVRDEGDGPSEFESQGLIDEGEVRINYSAALGHHHQRQPERPAVLPDVGHDDSSAASQRA